MLTIGYCEKKVTKIESQWGNLLILFIITHNNFYQCNVKTSKDVRQLYTTTTKSAKINKQIKVGKDETMTM